MNIQQTRRRLDECVLLMAEIRLTSWGWYFIPLFTRFIHPRWFSRRISSINHITQKKILIFQSVVSQTFPHSGAPSPGSSSVRSTGSCVPRSAFRSGELLGIFCHGISEWVANWCYQGIFHVSWIPGNPFWAGESCRISILGMLARRREQKGIWF